LGNGNPIGTEVKPGESTVVSHRPNELSKPTTESAPAVPNDVVKIASEPAVGQQNGHADKPEEKKEVPKPEEPKVEEKKETNGTNGADAKAGEKRKAEEDKVDAPVVPAESAVPPATESEPKKQKTTDVTEKKKPGRPKGAGTDKATKKEKKEPRIGQALRKTRSQGTA